MPRDLRNEREFSMSCTADACSQRRKACPTPMACHRPEASERSWLLSDLAVIGLACLVIVGFICGWFGGQS
jgi:hypothetical protein